MDTNLLADLLYPQIKTLPADIEARYPARVLPEGAKDVTVFCNPRAKTRDNMCACVSFDSGNTWSKVKVINPGHAAYSSLEWNPVTQKFCLLYETGEKHPYSDGITAAEFDMEWLLSE